MATLSNTRKCHQDHMHKTQQNGTAAVRFCFSLYRLHFYSKHFAFISQCSSQENIDSKSNRFCRTHLHRTILSKHNQTHRHRHVHSPQYTVRTNTQTCTHTTTHTTTHSPEKSQSFTCNIRQNTYNRHIRKRRQSAYTHEPNTNTTQ